MTINKLYISHENFNFASLLDTTFLNYSNFNQLLKKTEEINVATSIQDVGFENLEQLINICNEIELIELDEFLLLNSNDEHYYAISKLLLMLLTTNKKVINFEWIKNIRLRDYSILTQQRKSNEKTLWVFGCSISNGNGVKTNERYGNIIANEFPQYNYLNFSKPASSIWYQASLLLQSDIREGDLVIFALTTVSRPEVVKKDLILESVSFSDYLMLSPKLKYWNPLYFDSKTIYMITINNVLSVINYCKKVKANLILTNVLDPVVLPLAFKDEANFVNLVNNPDKNYKNVFLDIGNDGWHPGPMQHIVYAEKIISLIRKLKYDA